MPAGIATAPGHNPMKPSAAATGMKPAGMIPRSNKNGASSSSQRRWRLNRASGALTGR